MTLRKKILVVDDDTALAEMCVELLSKKGYEANMASGGKEAIETLEKDGVYDIVLTDFAMPHVDGLEILKRIKQRPHKVGQTDVVIMTSYGTINNAVEAMKLGAAEYITKPFKGDELTLIIDKIFSMRNLKNEVTRLHSELRTICKFDNILGNSAKMQQVYDIMARMRDTDATALICGETGTGKELVAKAIHYNGLRKNKPFVKVDCASLAETLLESELFGHEKGAFTGATKDRIGRFRTADTGTILLDEIGNIPLSVQAKLLRVLQDGEFEPVGGDKTVKVDVRIIAATNINLEEGVENGTFRSDLYYRLNVIKIHMPLLRKRLEDVPLLVTHFLERYRQKCHKDIKDISSAAMNKLMHYGWPGNVRELENLIERAVILCRGKIIEPDDLPLTIERPSFSDMSSGKSLQEMLDQTEHRVLLNTLNKTNWDKERAAKILQISRASLYNKIKKHGIIESETRATTYRTESVYTKT
ncbi:MAG: sigma-54-dependent transcriptional regulator [Candidatus Brocadiales bacterium]